ncbi:hypothetical protein F53441_12505 [Fusarium austroafricanum]|uniref:Retrotransposon gag domain-containing protein n=1 Tax=Fusarium austroafricanum TaxID=2364996 RepID=A0A8H4JXA4_9HYPO|nr:hypothetical protein F53441_12505 [Fusarium austroafricanum]
MASNTGPAPPYNGEPPSAAEMMAEIYQLRNTIRTLQARINDQPATTERTTTRAERDVGERLKPPKLDPFKGQASDIVPFLTRMKAYFSLFPNGFSSPKAKMLFTVPLLQGIASDWFEPILKDYLTYKHNEWDDDALMEIYYQGLKEEVKDELYKADRPDNMTEYVAMAIKIDERYLEDNKTTDKAEALGMCRDGYDMSIAKLLSSTTTGPPHPKSSIRMPSDPFMTLFQREVKAGHDVRIRRFRSQRSMGHRGTLATQHARRLRKEDEKLDQEWKDEYKPLFDEIDIRMYASPKDRCMQGAREHRNTDEIENIYIRASHTHDALNPRHRGENYHIKDDLKKDNDCFPVTIPSTPNDRPYLAKETEGYEVHSWSTKSTDYEKECKNCKKPWIQQKKNSK